MKQVTQHILSLVARETRSYRRTMKDNRDDVAKLVATVFTSVFGLNELQGTIIYKASLLTMDADEGYEAQEV